MERSKHFGWQLLAVKKLDFVRADRSHVLKPVRGCEKLYVPSLIEEAAHIRLNVMVGYQRRTGEAI
jgi:hypothetical protein